MEPSKYIYYILYILYTLYYIGQYISLSTSLRSQSCKASLSGTSVWYLFSTTCRLQLCFISLIKSWPENLLKTHRIGGLQLCTFPGIVVLNPFIDFALKVVSHLKSWDNQFCNASKTYWLWAEITLITIFYIPYSPLFVFFKPDGQHPCCLHDHPNLNTYFL